VAVLTLCIRKTLSDACLYSILCRLNLQTSGSLCGGSVHHKACTHTVIRAVAGFESQTVTTQSQQGTQLSVAARLSAWFGRQALAASRSPVLSPLRLYALGVYSSITFGGGYYLRRMRGAVPSRPPPRQCHYNNITSSFIAWYVDSWKVSLGSTRDRWNHDIEPGFLILKLVSDFTSCSFISYP
jgi:hypothetical protein